MKRAVKILSVLLAIGAALMLAAICYYFAVTAGIGLKEEKLNLPTPSSPWRIKIFTTIRESTISAS